MPNHVKCVLAGLGMILSIEILFATLPAVAAEKTCVNAVREFLDSPSNRTKNLLAKAAPDGCWAETSLLNDVVKRLNEVVASGNDAAAEYLMAHLPRPMAEIWRMP